ncbi:hypothetical protein ACG9XQ_05490 [Acinetobacter baumannii]|uniref:hypothetical protein n=1 Tax=Acinetobacter baumannii TaxID=470 RepID=UPI003AF861E5
MLTTIIPANTLGATIAPIYNGHIAIVSHNTDRLMDKKFVYAEMMAMKHNIQFTSFLHAYGETTTTKFDGVTIYENTNYGESLSELQKTGRISFGLYFRTDFWVNPRTGNRETIPDHNSDVWTNTGKLYYPNVVVGQPKVVRYPNHGHQLYIESNGEFGYNTETQTMGSSNLSETILHANQQIEYFKNLANISITSASYTNGAFGGWNVLIPFFFGARNSAYGFKGNEGNIKYNGLTRPEMMVEPSTTRTWDAANAGQFPSQTAAIDYHISELQRAIAANGWCSDFCHTHSVSDADDMGFYDTFWGRVDSEIGSADVWRAGNNEVNEYYVLANSINRIGSYVHNNKAYFVVRFKDMFIDTDTNGISNVIDPSKIVTPISIEFDLTGTVLADKNLKSYQATTLRSLGSNRWIANVSPINAYQNGCLLFEVEEAADNKQIYASSRPVITRAGDNIVTDRECKFVIYRKQIGVSDKYWEWIHRTSDFTAGIGYQFNTSTYTYAVGAITRSRVSNLITF